MGALTQPRPSRAYVWRRGRWLAKHRSGYENVERQGRHRETHTVGLSAVPARVGVASSRCSSSLARNRRGFISRCRGRLSQTRLAWGDQYMVEPAVLVASSDWFVGNKAVALSRAGRCPVSQLLNIYRCIDIL